MRPGWSRWRKVFAFQFVILVAFAAALEGACRLFFKDVADRTAYSLIPRKSATPVQSATFTVPGVADCRCQGSPECRLEVPFREQTFPCAPAVGATRILFLGESSVYGALLRPEETVPEQVKKSAAIRGVTVEPINGGISGRGLDTLFDVLRFLVPRVRPDIVVVYAGHNEVYPLTWYDASALPKSLRDEDRYYAAFRTFACLRLGSHVARRLIWNWETRKVHEDPDNCSRSNNDLVLDEKTFAQISAYRPVLWENSRIKLGWILDYCRQAGIKVLFCTPTGNLLLPPASPSHGPAYLARRADWDARWAVADGRLKGGRWREARESFAALIELDPEYAPTYHGLGIASLNLNDVAAARAWFDRCLDTIYIYRPVCHSLDPAPPSLVSALVEAARERDVPSWDTGEALRGGINPDHDPSLFLDRLHFSRTGARVFAERLVEHLLQAGWLAGGPRRDALPNLPRRMERAKP